jgi:hypothetical protein
MNENNSVISSISNKEQKMQIFNYINKNNISQNNKYTNVQNNYNQTYGICCVHNDNEDLDDEIDMKDNQ